MNKILKNLGAMALSIGATCIVACGLTWAAVLIGRWVVCK